MAEEKVINGAAEKPAAINAVGKKERTAFYFSAFFRDMSYNIVGGFLLLFYIDIMGFAGTAALIVIPIITRIWDGINDPLLGAYYDKRHYTTEKARPIFKHTTLIIATMLILMFFAPKFSDNSKVDYVIKCIYAVITYGIFEGLHTLNGTAFMSLYNSISPHPDERTKIITVSRLFSAGGTALVSAIIPVLLGLFRNDDVKAKTYIYLGSACVIALLFIIYNFLMYRYVRERTIVPPKEQQQLWPMLKRFVKNRLLMLMICANVIGGLINLGGVSLYFYTYNMGNPALLSVLGFFTVPTYIIGSLIVPALVKKYNKRDLVIVCSVLPIAANILYLFAGYRPEIWMILAVSLFTNLFVSIKGVLYWNMIADSVDYAEWKTGFRNDGMIYSIEGCVGKIIGAVGTMAVGIFITLSHFVPNAQTQSEYTMKALFYVPLIIGIILSILSTIPYFFYDMDRKQHAQILAELKARKEAAELQAAGKEA